MEGLENMNLLKNKLFYFLWIGGETFLAGAVNICAIILFGKTITHHTGNISFAAMALANGEILTFIKIFIYIFMFFLGSIISGLLYYRTKQSVIQYHAIAPIAFGIILFLSFNIIGANEVFLGIFAFGMGIKNGIYIKIRGVLVRKTHMTGYLSDLAFVISEVIRGNREEVWKLKFYLFSIIIFFIGGLAFAVIIQIIDVRIIELLAILYIIIGFLVSLGIVKGIVEDDTSIE